MKCPRTLGLALVALVLANAGNADTTAETPMAKLVTVLTDMSAGITKSGKAEQASYDKYSCWCEETMQEKAGDITAAKQSIDDLETGIVKNKALIAAGGATIAKRKRDMTDNDKSQQEATEVRNGEHASYTQGTSAAQQNIGALESAINTIAASAKGKKGFLETLQEAKLISAVATLRPVMETAEAHKMKGTDLEVVSRFVAKPEEFFKGHASQSALQTGNNPFGDFSDSSTKIQGVLKSMYDTFAGDLEADSVQEANRQKSFEALMVTKRREHSDMKGSLRTETKASAERSRAVALSKATLDDTKDALDADEHFFTSSKEHCQAKANSWAQRTRLRSQELSGISKAIGILNSDEAKKTFSSATKFLQVSAVVHHPREEAYSRLKSVAAKFQDIKLAQIAISAKTTGHFDDIIVKIDKMIGVLRQEEAEDISHRDRCEAKQNDNKNSMEDANLGINKEQTTIKRLDNEEKETTADIKAFQASMEKTQKKIDDVTESRKNDAATYRQTVKDDKDSLALLEQAQAAFVKFYSDTSLVHVDAAPATYDTDVAPHTTFDKEGGAYKGSTGEATGVVAIVEMIKEDLRKELKVSGQAEVDAQVAYLATHNALKEIWRASDAARTTAVVELSVFKTDNQEASDKKDEHAKDLADEKALEIAINTDCQWVEMVFEKRRASRKEEIDGLVGSKDFLAGVGSENDFSFPDEK